MIRDIKKILSPKDKQTLYSDAETSWVPEDPIETILPYIEESSTEDKTSLDYRLKKAKEVYEGYGNLINECKKIEDYISDRSKNVVITLDPKKHLNIISSVKRLFGTDGKVITFDMYKQVIHKMAEISNSEIPEPGSK